MSFWSFLCGAENTLGFRGYLAFYQWEILEPRGGKGEDKKDAKWEAKRDTKRDAEELAERS